MPHSSSDLVAALLAQGFTEGKGTGKRGSHRTYHRARAGQTSQTMTVVLNQREIPTGTLRGCARQAGITLDELLQWLTER